MEPAVLEEIDVLYKDVEYIANMVGNNNMEFMIAGPLKGGESIARRSPSPLLRLTVALAGFYELYVRLWPLWLIRYQFEHFESTGRYTPGQGSRSIRSFSLFMESRQAYHNHENGFPDLDLQRLSHRSVVHLSNAEKRDPWVGSAVKWMPYGDIVGAPVAPAAPAAPAAPTAPTAAPAKTVLLLPAAR